MFEEKIKPSLVLTLICLITCALLVIAYEATYVDSTGVITDKMVAGLNEIYGTSYGFEMLTNDDGSVYTPEGVSSVLKNSDGNTAFEITTDGYSSDGLHVLIGISSDGAVSGVSILTIGETPGLGTKVQNSDFLDQFKGVTFDKLPSDSAEETTDAKYVWGEKSEIDALSEAAASAPAADTFELDAVTGATFSSKGMNRAVTIALTAYNEMINGASGGDTEVVAVDLTANNETEGAEQQ
ncbi:MAG: FMN-binding protein [Oscillospiraceae bacterium]|nr:FMN-binding protein [Oscillospiraceae bacterium]